jgi:hypothetical protein
MRDVELVLKAVMCFVKGIVNISTIEPYATSAGMTVCVWLKHK